MNENIIEFDRLCKKAKDGDADASWLIIIRLRPFIIKCAHSIYLKNYDVEDIISVANIALMRSIKHFKLGGTKHFFPYAIITIRNALNMEVRMVAKYWKEGSLEGYIDKNGEGIGICGNQESIEERYVKKELVKKRIDVLNCEERKLIIALFYGGISIVKYAKINKLNYKKCSNMKLKALRKMKKVK